MHISFDLDGTLIPFNNEFTVEKRSYLAKLFGIEPIRKGTARLVRTLQKSGYTIHIYTTSYRSPLKIRCMLWYYNIHVNTIINQTKNNSVLMRKGITASKHPPTYGFNIHIDDAMGVLQEGVRFNFKVIHIASEITNWKEYIISSIKKEELL